MQHVECMEYAEGTGEPACQACPGHSAANILLRDLRIGPGNSRPRMRINWSWMDVDRGEGAGDHEAKIYRLIVVRD